MKTCNKCGLLYEENVKFCSKCGGGLEALEVPQQQIVNDSPVSTVESKKNNGSKIAIIVLSIILAVAVLGAGCYFLFFKDKPNDKSEKKEETVSSDSSDEKNSKAKDSSDKNSPKATATASGVIDSDCQWAFYEDEGKLVISGEGILGEVYVISQRENGTYYDEGLVGLWSDYVDQITTLVIEEGISEISYKAFQNYKNLKTVSLPDSLISISHLAFCGDSSLETITIPKNVKEIGNLCFSGSGLKSINVVKENRFLESYEGVLFDKKMEKLICYPQGKKEISYTVPDGVKFIREEAFDYPENLKVLTLPNSVENVEYMSDLLIFAAKLDELHYEGTEEQWNEFVAANRHEYITNDVDGFDDLLQQVNVTFKK